MKALRADGPWIKDRHGRVVILRGVNAGGDAKLPPFLGLAREECADQIRSWGMNAVRLATVWEAVEPRPGEIDRDYLDRLADQARWLCARGVHVIVDMHQDLFARRFGGDGAPDWAVDEPADGLHCRGGAEWFLNYLSPPVNRAFTRFWTDGALQDHFLAALGAVSERLASEERVVGYDVLNEPWHGEIDLPSGRFERDVLAPFYRRAARAIRAHDPDALIFVEPATFAAGLVMMQSRLPPLDVPGVVYAPHYYPVTAMIDPELGIDEIAGGVRRDLALVRAKADELGAPALLGEFGAFPKQRDQVGVIGAFYRALDEALLGGTIWEYALRDREWNEEAMSLVDADLAERPTARAAARPYAAAIAGVPTRMSWDPTSRRFELDYDADPRASAPTVIRVPRGAAADALPPATDGEILHAPSAPGPQRVVIRIARADGGAAPERPR